MRGKASLFFVIDHYTVECLGIHASLRSTRFEALVQVGREVFGEFREGIAKDKGLKLRHDHGSSFVSRHFQKEQLLWV